MDDEDTEPDRSSGSSDEEGSEPDSLKELAESVKERRDEGAVSPDSDVEVPDLGFGAEAEDEGDVAAGEEDPDSEQDLPSRFQWFGSGRSGGDLPSIPDPVRDASNLLLLGPLTGPRCDRNCFRLLTTDEPRRTNALLVTVTRSADDRLDSYQEYVEEPFANVTVIAVAERSASRSSSVISVGDDRNQIEIKRISDIDIVRLGVMLTRVLSEWRDDGNRTVVCFHSLTALLQYVDPQRLFRFLHVLLNKLDDLDAVSHYHMNPEVHDDQTVALFRPLFEAVARVTDEDGLELVD